MSQVMSPRDLEALAFAREKFLQMQSEKADAFGGIEVFWLEKVENRRFAVEMIKRHTMFSPSNMMDVVHYAREGWGLADRALRELILEHMNRGQALPTYLAAYNMEIVQRPIAKRPAREKADYFLRDISITVVVILLVEKFGLKPTARNNNVCACSIAGEALGAINSRMSYKAVERIWNKYGHI